MEANRAGPFGQQRIPQPTKERHAEKKRNKIQKSNRIVFMRNIFQGCRYSDSFFFSGVFV